MASKISSIPIGMVTVSSCMEGIIVLWGLVDNWSISTLFDGMSQEGSWAIEWLDGNISGLVGERLGHGNNSDLMELVQTSIPR